MKVEKSQSVVSGYFPLANNLASLIYSLDSF